MTNKKNSFWRFLFSLIPGAGEMYMGFLKMGTSLMGLFLFIIFIASSLNFGEIIILDIIIWFFSFFHVHSLAGMTDEEFYAVEDNFLFFSSDFSFEGKAFFQNNRKTIAAVLIFAGALMTWRSVLRFFEDLLPWGIFRYFFEMSYQLPRLLISIGIIVLGLILIRGKKKELDMPDGKENENGN